MRSRRGGGGEPLLSTGEDVFQDEWLPRAPAHRHQQQRRRRGGPPQQQMMHSNHYQAPRVSGVTVQRQQSSVRGQEEQQRQPEVPYRDGGVHRKQVLIHHIRHTLIKKKNPAKDLAITWLSYGGLCFQCVRTQEIGLMENFGKFDTLLQPGLYVFCWPYSTIAARMSLRIQQLDIVCETKTKDHVFVHITVSIQYRVLPEMAYMAHYRINDVTVPIQAHILHVVRSTVPTTMDLDQVFANKHEIADAIGTSLRLLLRHEFGYDLVHTLCTNVMPASAEVQRAMNEVEACRREKLATPHQAEANKTLTIRAAEGRAEAAYLNGVGTARERHSIARGMQQSAAEWRDAETKDMEFSEVTQLLLVTQYIDLLAHMSANDIMVRPGPGEVLDMRQEGLIINRRKGYDSSDDDSSRCSSSSEADDEREEIVAIETFDTDLLTFENETPLLV
jgi:regulator of protease activity HflC (stomatin/prohibitin superfamily)